MELYLTCCMPSSVLIIQVLAANCNTNSKLTGITDETTSLRQVRAGLSLQFAKSQADIISAYADITRNFRIWVCYTHIIFDDCYVVIWCAYSCLVEESVQT